MSFEQKDLTGALFVNEDRKSERHPMHTGSCTINGQQYFVDAWMNEGRNGKCYLSLKFKAKKPREQGASPNPRRSPRSRTTSTTTSRSSPRTTRC